jgi:hypothetical protein
MTLLFNKTNTGTTEIREILGFTDADLTFDVLKPKIEPATDILIELIGQPLYNDLVTIYLSNTPSGTNAEFLKRVQTIILLDAYRNHAKYVDLAHTVNGRKNRVEDKEKIAFEWQIDRSDKKMERDYYIAVDKLIKYMDKNVTNWKTSDAYKLTQELFIRTASEIDEFFNIDGSRLLFLKLAPGMKKCERENIISRITKERFDDLKNNLKNNQSGYDEVLVYKIKEAVVYKALAWGIPRLSAQLFPEGVLTVADTSRLSTSARISTEKTHAEGLAMKFRKDADDAFIEIENYIKSLQPIQPLAEYPTKPKFNITDTFVDC